MTGGCNLACQHCWLSPSYQAQGGTGGHLDYDLFALAVAEGLPLGLSGVKLTGGEPLLHPDFVHFVDLVAEKRLDLTVETNGTLMTAGLARYLKEKSTLRHISVSLDGAIASTHDRFRGVKGSFEKALQGIHHLVEAGYHPQIIMSVHAGNMQEIEALVQLAEKSGAGSIKFNLIQPSGRGKAMTERGQILDIPQLVELGKWVEGNLQKRTGVRLRYSWPKAFQRISQLLSNRTDSCGIFNVLGILSSGHLAMCGIGVLLPNLCYGLLGQDSVAKVWSSHPVLAELRRDLPEKLDGVCGKCLFKSVCLGYCAANNYLLTHSLTGANWFCRGTAQAGLFPMTRLKKSLSSPNIS
jgi:SynChlorMet cassette radical SAM/SPASM protein ScmF